MPNLGDKPITDESVDDMDEIIKDEDTDIEEDADVEPDADLEDDDEIEEVEGEDIDE